MQGSFRAVSVGGSHSCAIANDDTIICWGNNEDGQAVAPGGTWESVVQEDGGRRLTELTIRRPDLKRFETTRWTPLR